MGMEEKYIASLDIGTTTIRCYIFDSNVNICGKATDQVELYYPEPGHVEIQPEHLWNTVILTIKNAIADANLKPENILSIGITTQRGTFVTWDKNSGELFHNFVTWKDLRASDLVTKWNSSFIMKSIRAGSRSLYMLTRSPRFLAGSVLKFMNTQTTLRLLWVLQNNEKLQKAIANKTALFGTLDSWLLYRLRQGADRTKTVEHITDITNATATGFFDPFTLSWANWALKIFSIDSDILPKVVNNSYEFGFIDESLFGTKIKIGGCISDQSASLWGSGCFNKSDIKVTLGTGSFLNVNTGNKCSASILGLYPLVAWEFNNKSNSNKTELAYCVEGASNDTGSIIKWAMNFGLFVDPTTTSDIANSVENTDGTYFIPAFSGLGSGKPVFWKKGRRYSWHKAPMNDNQAATGIIGIRPSTENAHLVRAVLESIAYRVTQLYMCALKETNFKYNTIKVDGGVSRNDFICQLLADLTGLIVERPINTEVSVLGAGFLAGLNTGIWNDKEDLLKLRKIDRIFKPRSDLQAELQNRMKSWERAVERFKYWYSPNEIETLSKSCMSLSSK